MGAEMQSENRRWTRINADGVARLFGHPHRVFSGRIGIIKEKSLRSVLNLRLSASICGLKMIRSGRPNTSSDACFYASADDAAHRTR
jgi:hypothetical protein